MTHLRRVHVRYITDPADLDARLDRLMNALIEAGVPEPDLSAKLSTGEVHLMLGSAPQPAATTDGDHYLWHASDHNVRCSSCSWTGYRHPHARSYLRKACPACGARVEVIP